MREKVLFEIPIYTMSEDVFNKRWKEKKDKLCSEFLANGLAKDQAEQGVSSCYYPKWLWRYNQIIGFIKISVTATDVIFDVFCSMDKKYHIDSKQKHFIEDWRCNGTHFYAVGKSENAIKKEIKEWLEIIETDHLKNRFYIDYSTFNNIFGFVKISTVMKTLSE